MHHRHHEGQPKFAEGESKRRKIVDDFTLNISRCIQCSICVEVCNFEAIEMTHTFEKAHFYPDTVADMPTLFEMGRANHDEDNDLPARETRDRL